MILTKEQRNAIALLLVASDRTKVGNFDLEDEQNARTILRAMIDSSGTVGPGGGFDVEKTRTWNERQKEIIKERFHCACGTCHACGFSPDQTNRAIAEIERLQAENAEAQESLTAAYRLGSHKKAQEMAYLLTELKADLERPEPAAPVEGKIGPDADAKPRVWQITEEREAAVDFALEYISDDANDSNDPGICFCVEALRAMLTEAGQ